MRSDVYLAACHEELISSEKSFKMNYLLNGKLVMIGEERSNMVELCSRVLNILVLFQDRVC